MPAELINRGGATVTLPAEKIALQINAWLGC
jgi:two-component system chemotaxis response regulator CheB